MLIFSIIIFLYLFVQLIFLQITHIHNISFFSIAMILATSILYSRLIFQFKYRPRVIINALFIALTFFLSFGNIFYYYIKGSFFSISQLGLIDELAGVTDSVTGYFKWVYLLLLLIPIGFYFVSKKHLKSDTIHFSRRAIGITALLLVVLNIGFYASDSLLYKTIYSPVNYAREFGFISYYARDLTPFSKVSLDDYQIENTAVIPEETEYSGYLKDKTNVVFVIAESFDDIAIDQTLTPTLYKMANDGMFFENYYTLTTMTNGSEFSTLTSLHPPLDYARVPDYTGTYTSLPEIFNQQDFCTFGFHLNTQTFYEREDTYPNLYHFSQSYFTEQMAPETSLRDARDELTFELSQKYIEQADCDKNFTYYMSAFGHSPYEDNSKQTIKEDYQYVHSVYPENDEHLNSYLASQMSLDQMFEEMIDYYTEQGEIDDTVFIVVGDHYPYALGDPEHPYGEFSTEFVENSFSGEPFETYNVPFFIYDPTATLPDNDKYISNIDILPTVADMFGYDYQYAEGTSALSDVDNGVVKWFGYEDYGVLSNDTTYIDGLVNGEEPTPEQKQKIDDDKMYSAKLYSMFDQQS